MYENLSTQAAPAIDKLIGLDEEEVYQELGRRVVAMQESPSKVASFNFQADSNEGFESLKNISGIGHQFFDNLNQIAYDACCGESDGHKEITEMMDKGTTAVASAIAAVLVSSIGIAAAIASAFAVIIVKIVAKAAGKTMCQAWKDQLPIPPKPAT